MTLFLTGCGIPQAAYLEPPTFNGDVNNANVSFKVTFYNFPNNNPNIFQGFQIYYKLYTESEFNSSWASDKTAILTQSDLSKNGYARLYEGLDNPGDPSTVGSVKDLLNLLPVDTANKDSIFSITVDFSNDQPTGSGTNTFYNSTASYNGKTVLLSRYIYQDRLDPNLGTIRYPRNLSTVSGFYENDKDIPLTYNNPLTLPLYMGLYAVTYGTEISIPTPVYSIPKCLGIIQFNVNSLN